MKTILVLTDFSDAATNAALYAAALTHHLEISRLILYHSYELKPPVQTAVPVLEPADVERFYKDSMENLALLKDKLRSFTNERTVIETLADDRHLIIASESIGAQQQVGLLVMGVTGKSRLEQVLIGSNTITVAKESTIPVLLVPREVRFEKIRRIVFACDLKKVSTSTPVKQISSLLHQLDAKLLVLNVDTEDQEHFTPDTITEQTVLHQLWDKERPEYHYTNADNIAKGITQFALKHDVQLVIAVPKQYGFFESLFHSSMTKKLTFEISVPLLLVKERPD
ncbi:universal stress protein [Mucilaginibacter sp.]|jgi:nucleotide-binding universal stress UspA family protein|uniref:universal stress protein n=1 Tax=Mucilaginibacter sp. TaxID=1882438 RepID=UPI003569C6E3